MNDKKNKKSCIKVIRNSEFFRITVRQVFQSIFHSNIEKYGIDFITVTSFEIVCSEVADFLCLVICLLD